MLKEYHTNIGFPTFPKYKEASCVDDGRFIVEVKVKKKYQFLCEDAKPRKKDVEVWLAEQAVKVLEGEKKISPVEENAKSRLNVLLQSQGGASKYNIQGDQAKFTGFCCSILLIFTKVWLHRKQKRKPISLLLYVCL